MKSPTILFILLPLLSFGCSEQNSPDPETSSVAESATQSAAAAANTPNFSSLKLCELLPAQDVAATLSAEVYKPSRGQDYGSSQFCEYELTPTGPDQYEYAAVWIYPESMYDDSDASEVLTGLADRAFLIYRPEEQQASVVMLVSGKASLEAKAETADHAKALAALLLERVGGKL